MAASVAPEQSEDLVLLRAQRSPFEPLRLACVSAALLLQRIELLLLAVAAPMLVFPGRATAIGAAVIAATWVTRRVATGRWSVATRVDRWVPFFLIALFVSLLPSLRLAELGMLTVGALLAAVGVAGMASPPDKLIDDRGIYAALPHLVTSVQSSTVVTQGINPNELAGTLILVVPLAVVRACQPGYVRWPALALAFCMTIVVVLTQSRAALLGLLGAACVGIVWSAGRRGLV